MKTVTCHISKKEIPVADAKKADDLQKNLYELIEREHPGFTSSSYISTEELNVYRKNYVSGLIQQEIGDLDQLEKEVVESIGNNKILAENIEDDIDEKLSYGQKVADRIAVFGGSWGFIITFFAFIIGWMVLNSVILVKNPLDRYPYMALNLILSCIAAVQAPIIMMSQNRQGEKDRQRSEHDYKINLKAELEIKLLHEKIDHLMIHQNKRLLEIQEIQADYLEDILNNLKGTDNAK